MAFKAELTSPQARRRARTDERLHAAVNLLAGDPNAALTVAALARAAGVGRNIIYTHHAHVLETLREVQAQRTTLKSNGAAAADRTRATLRDAEARISALATQNAMLLKRILETERKAALSERRNAQLVQELDRIQRPVVIRTS